MDAKELFPFFLGIIGGKFLERSRIKKPNQQPYSTDMSQYYLSNDLFVGACVNFNSHIFVLIDADEYAFRYMEQNPGVSLEYFLFFIKICF